jgi:ATP-dependent protease Clp ATPase subunit
LAPKDIRSIMWKIEEQENERQRIKGKDSQGTGEEISRIVNRIRTLNGMLLIFAGLIDNFESALKRLKDKKSSIGFGSQSAVRRGSYLYDLLIDYGMIPEFLNRLSAIVPFRQLGLDDFIKIATYEHGAISHFNKMLEPQGLTISFTERAITEMAQFCMDTSQARGLHMLIGSIAEEAIFNGATGTIEYDVEAVKKAEDKMEAE